MTKASQGVGKPQSRCTATSSSATLTYCIAPLPTQ